LDSKPKDENFYLSAALITNIENFEFISEILKRAIYNDKMAILAKILLRLI
jgi:hypothetical protein